MNSIIAKREEYLNQINKINNIINEEIQNYKSCLEKECEDKLAIFTAETTARYSSELKKYEERIAVLEDIIKEEMPSVEPLVEILKEEPMEEQKVVEEIKEPTLIIEETNEAVEAINEVFEENLNNVEVDPVVTGAKIFSRAGMSSIECPSRS